MHGGLDKVSSAGKRCKAWRIVPFTQISDAVTMAGLHSSCMGAIYHCILGTSLDLWSTTVCDAYCIFRVINVVKCSMIRKVMIVII